jgi:hypothetical protein
MKGYSAINLGSLYGLSGISVTPPHGAIDLGLPGHGGETALAPVMIRLVLAIGDAVERAAVLDDLLPVHARGT